ncbi:FkbM family methyltransferase [Aliidongia dinghuensis]|uniref:FkbM family methyltransferase n=1 Tax=Aliidongia dinghuensis TaxID=1867774 RepID=UPI0016680BC6|nr:FkbM family methyltransferase [Aliidongia dinghuensis]
MPEPVHAADDAGPVYPAGGFVSYAQNGEDVLLWRALHRLPSGFYIDVGAQDPCKDSVTRAFYERGWRGINIEPVSDHYEKLCRDRPYDITLQLALGAEPGFATFYEVPDTGLSTMVETIALKHTQDGHAAIRRNIEVRTLASICEELVDGDIHFLKVDVEGFERQVLLGAAFDRFRPWIVLVEATKPNSPVSTADQWEDLLLAAGYALVHFDGLNRYYVAAERSELKASFAAPPNIFDGYLTAATVELGHGLEATRRDLEGRLAGTEAQAQELRSELHKSARRLEACAAELAEAETRAQELKRQAYELRNEIFHSERRIVAIYESTSWKLTAPIRALKPLAMTIRRLLGRVLGDGEVGARG